MISVFLDLDGTLLDSKPGILASLGHALRETGHADVAETDMTWMIGPPFHESFAKLGLRDPEGTLAAYRTHYKASGMYDATIYDGIEAAIDRIAGDGATLYLATAKPHDYARKITAHFGLARRFKAEYGPELDGTRGWKGDLLAHALAETGIDPARAIMVGDRHHDFAAAAEVGMKSVAVLWGYGSADEHAHADYICAAPTGLPDVVAGWLAEIAPPVSPR